MRRRLFIFAPLLFEKEVITSVRQADCLCKLATRFSSVKGWQDEIPDSYCRRAVRAGSG